MGNIRRGTISRDYVDALKLDVGNGASNPTEASEKVVLTYDYSNTKDITPQGMSWTATGGSTTMYVIPIGYRCEIWGVHWAYIKDATCDQATSSMTIGVTIGGVAYSFPLWENLTLTAQSGQGSEAFNVPIVCDQNTNITVSARAYTAGVYRGRITVMTRLVPI